MPKPLFVAVLLSIMLRVFLAETLGISDDEAYYWTWSQRLDFGYFDHPPMIAWWIALGDLLGEGRFAVRLIHLIAFPIMLSLFWDLSDHEERSLWLLLSYPLFIASILATPDLPLLFFWTLSLWAMKKNRFGWLCLAISGAILSKLTALLLIPIIALANPSLLKEGKFYALMGGILILISPFIVWNLNHDWISFTFQLNHIENSSSHLSFFVSQWALFGLLIFPFLFVKIKEMSSNDRLAFWATFPLLFLGLAFGGEANWIAPSYIGGALLLGKLRGAIGRCITIGIALNFSILCILSLHVIHPLLDFPNDPLNRLHQQLTLGEAIEAFGEHQIWTTRYQEAALVWYSTSIPTNTLPMSGRGSQFDLWREDLPDNGLFLRPHRQSNYREIEEFNRVSNKEFLIKEFSNENNLIHHWQVFIFKKAE